MPAPPPPPVDRPLRATGPAGAEPDARALEFKQLRFFVRVVDIGSITRAAQALHIAQPALSKHLADLEHALNATLLVRSPQGIVPTEQGRALYAAAQRILREVEAVAGHVAAIGQTPVGSVRMGCLESTAMALAYPLAVDVMQRYPGVRLVMVAGQGRDLYRRLIAGDLDLVVLAPDEEITGVQRRVLVEEELFIVGSTKLPGFVEGSTIEVAELAELPFVLPSRTSYSTRSLMRKVFEQHGFEPHTVIESDALVLVKRLVFEGHGVSVLPWTVVEDGLEADRVRLKRIAGIPLMRRLELCRRNDQLPTAAIDSVIDSVLGTVVRLVEAGAWRHATPIASAAWN
ncbi:LysR family transcriptional regulator [Aquabacterium sp.]|uniref:LysR family transcriptional regulator n=1 Tax=Aquabacterium sp. TaxID=1872578 RepID=UPI002BF84F42|nr:LysR substrate-binding domain-containing protein [Aquabacterium sp.]HSW05196.1 LysR substrate-binding domain-containing protein [Aquabacterium sp.]